MTATPAKGLGTVAAGDVLPELRVTVSAAANERYWRSAGIDHPRLRAGVLYPLIAANLSVLAFQQRCPDPMIQTRQRLVCHRTQSAGVELVVTGAVLDRYSKRGREYADVRTVVSCGEGPGAPIWTSEVSFTPAATPDPRA